MSDALRFTDQHEWIRLEADEGVIGVTEFAQAQLGDIVFVELPTIGTTFAQGDEVGVIESVKAASELCAPVSGTVTAINEALVDAPEMINRSAEAEGWIFRLRLADAGECDSLLDAAAYRELTANQS